MIEQNEKMPTGELQELTSDGMTIHNTDELFANKKVVLFAVPGAFTPTCSESHLPGYITLADQIMAKGVEQIICLSVNDAFVMKAWGETQNAEHILMLGDGDASYTKLLGLELPSMPAIGVRSKRYAMIIDNGVVTNLLVEKPKEFEVSNAESVLAIL